MTTINAERDVNINRTLFADTCHGVDLISDGLNAHTTFVDDELKTVLPVTFLEVFGQ